MEILRLKFNGMHEIAASVNKYLDTNFKSCSRVAFIVIYNGYALKDIKPTYHCDAN